MPRELPRNHRRMAEEAVHAGMAAAVVMEAAAREWVAIEGEETFPDWLVRREVLRREQITELAELVAAESEPGTEGTDAPPAADGAAPPRAPHPSEVIKGYRILERLGRGGMGSVYRAEQAGMNRVVALKILRRPFGQVEEHVERLRREARLVGALDHPNIVRGLDVGQHGPYHYFAMEFVDGETLRDLLKRRGIIPESEALRLVEQVTLALDHAHSRGIVHRDVKPGNIIVTPDGTPKLTDYGLAKGPADFTLTQSGVTIGTPQYISPEQARDPVGVGIQTDLYSLGATAYHMLTGIPPHTSDTLAGLLTKVLYEKPRTARQVNPKVSAGASFLVEKMMAKQPRHRYREPREVLRDLRALAAGDSIVPRNWAGDFDVHEARRRVRLIAAGAAAAMLLLVAATGWLQWRGREQARRDREDGAVGRLAVIDATWGNPRNREEWTRRLIALEGFLREKPNQGTAAFAVATGAQQESQGHVNAWDRADAVRSMAEPKERALQFRDAIQIIRRELSLFDREELRFGREPAAWLKEEIGRIRDAGKEQARKESAEAVERAGKAPAVEGIAERIQADLVAAKDRCRDVLLDDGDLRALQEIEELIALLQRTRASVEDSTFGPGFRQTLDRLLEDGEFAQAEEGIRQAMDAVQRDAELQANLERLPAPAAADLRGRGPRELAAVQARNETVLADQGARAKGLADAGNFDAAVEILEGAEERSMAALRETAAARKAEVVGRRDEAERAVAEARRAFLRDVFDAVVRREFPVARKIAGGAAAVAPPALRPGIAVAALSALKTLGLVDTLGYDRIRARIVEKGGVPELQFTKDGRVQQRYGEVSRVRVQDADTGPVLVFDEPGQPDLRGELYRLTLPLALSYSGLDGAGLSNEQVLVRALLVVLAPEGEKVERRDLEAAAGQLRRIRDLVDQSGPVVDALLARVESLIDVRVQQDRDLEKEAESTLKEVDDSMRARNPKDALYRLQRLKSEALKGTKFVAANQERIRGLAVAAQAMLDDMKVEGFFPGATVEVLPAEPGGEARTRISWGFESEVEGQSFVRVEDPPWRIVKDPSPESNVGPGNGRLVFLEGGPNRDLAACPLALECIFRTQRSMALQFRMRAEAPKYWQVSMAGNHVGVLTDDGRRTGGRGVYAWQREDWQGPDLAFPDSYRRESLPKVPNLLAVRVEEGQKYFQFENGVTYLVRVEWDRARIRLIVDGREIWNARLRSDIVRDKTPRFRIVTFTGGWIDDLSVEGVVDKEYLSRLLRKR